MFKRATVTFDTSRIAFHYQDFRNIKDYGLPQYPPGHRAAVPVQRERLSDLYVDVLLTGSRHTAPPDQDHRGESHANGDGVGDPIPEVPIPMHDRKSLNELDERAERRQQRRDHEQIAPRKAATARPVRA